MKQICDDLAKEHGALDKIVSGLDEKDWKIVTPFSGWTIQDEIIHLTYFDSSAKLSASDTDAFNRHLGEFLQGAQSAADIHERVLNSGRSKNSVEMLKWWREERTAMLKAYRVCDPKARLPWYGPTMSARSSATARLMETWAHGQDVADALGVKRELTDSLKHIAHLGVTTFGWSFSTNNMDAPKAEVRVDLTSPKNEHWTWGHENAVDRVSGTAEDFCLAIVRRRHIEDTNLKIEGPVASTWMTIAQAFAGPPEKCPPPGKFPLKKATP